MNIGRLLNQTLIWWKKRGIDQYAVAIVDDPVNISGRWENKNKKIEAVGGGEIVSSSIVFVDGEQQTILIGDWLKLGNISELTSSNWLSPKEVIGAKEAIHIEVTPDVISATFETKIYL